MDIQIKSDECRLAVRCWGGSGEPILLLHGLGSSLAAWSPLVPSLTTGHRVIALDLRGHGRSTAAPWTWNSAIADIDAVLAHFNVTEAKLLGHSLGGVLAVVYASRRPSVTSVVNIDGHTTCDPAMFRGCDPCRVQDKLGVMRRVQEQRTARRLSPGEVAAIAEAAESRAGANGELPATAREAIVRSLEQLPCGNFRPRPGPRELSSVLDALDELNLSRSHPALQLELVPSTHARLLREPRVAGLISTFLDQVAD